jgi:hypothetical protein
MSEGHAKFSPSSAHRWMRCPGSIQAEEGIQDSSSSYAEEGTAAHELAALCLTQGTDAAGYLGRLMQNGVEVTDDMAEHVQTYVDLVRGLAEGHELLVEQRVDFSAYIGLPKQTGTADAVILSACGTWIHIIDLKFGRGVQVDAESNEQLCLYALGAYDQFSALSDYKRVRMTIHQPRLSHVSEAEMLTDDLLEFGHQAQLAATEALADDAPRHPGPKQCKWCKVKATCPELAVSVFDIVAPGFEPTTATAEDFADLTLTPVAMLSAEQIGLLIPHLELVEDWCKAVAAQALAMELRGEDVPGYKAVPGRRGARAWRDAAVAEETLKSMRLKKEEMYDFKLISPTSAEKLLKDSPRRWQKLQELITQPEGKPTLAPDTDKRPAISTVDDFADLT